jgi:hypothetical protein
MPETSENSAAVHGTPLTSQLLPTDAMTLKLREGGNVELENENWFITQLARLAIIDP